MSGCGGFLRGLIGENPRLLAAVIDCNRLLPERLTADAVRPEAAALLPLIKQSGKASARALRFVPLLTASGDERANEQPPTWWALDFRKVRHRLALLPPELLVKLAERFGLAIHREAVARIIGHKDVLAFRAEFGEDGHRFALRRSSLLPGIRGLTAEENAEHPLAWRIRWSGYGAVAACLADAPAEALAIVTKTVPRDFAERIAQTVSTPPDEETLQRLQPLVRTLLFKEIAPEWQACFS